MGPLSDHWQRERDELMTRGSAAREQNQPGRTGSPRRFRGVLMLFAAILLAPLAIAGFAVAGDPGEDDFYKQFPVFQDVLRLVRQAYVDDVDLSQLMAGAFQGLGDALDPFSTLVPSDRVAALKQLDERPPASGMVLAHANGVLYVVSVLPDSPAEAADIRPGDILTEIDGLPTRNLSLWNAELLMADIPQAPEPMAAESTGAGEAEDGDGVGLSVGILRRGDQWTVHLDSPLVQSPGSSVEVDSEVATLSVFDVSPTSVTAIAAGLREQATSGLGGLLVDLRRSSGTDYESAVEIAGLLGVTGAADFVDRDGNRRHLEARTEPAWAGPVVVLVGQATHGAGELLARLLSERYATVGQPTFGYLGRPAWLPVGDGHQMRTADGFYGPAGEGTWDEPLEPEIIVRGRDRRFSQQDQTLEELTTQRALEVIRSEAVGRAA